MADIKLAPLRGLWITPGPLGVSPPGSMQRCDNIVFRKPGVLEPLPADDQVVNTPLPTDYLPRRMFPARPNKMLLVGEKDDDSDTWLTKWVTVDAGVVSDVSLHGSPPKYDSGRVQAVYYPGSNSQDGRQYVTSRNNLLRMNVATPTLAQRSGLSTPMGVIGALIPASDGRAYPIGAEANYRAIFKRTFDDGFTPEYTSPPSNLIRVKNIDASVRNMALQIGWATGLEEIELVAGSTLTVELYRTRTVVGDRDPGGRCFLVGSAVVDATALTTRTVTIIDRIKDDELGEALYTNTGEQGIAAARYQSPRLRDVTEYRGTLYGIVERERQSITLYVGVPWGVLTTSTERANGIGERTVTGTVVIGLATVTGVSATDDKGIAVGQLVTSGGWPAGTRVLSAVPGTITMDQNATGTPATTTVIDQIEIDGTKYSMQLPITLYVFLHSQASYVYEIIFSRALLGLTGGGIDNQSGIAFTIARHYAGIDAADDAFGVRATNGDKYSPPLEDFTGSDTDSTAQIEENRLGWCANNQPDHWPLGNRETLGNGTLLRLISTAETMYAFSTEGRVYRISGFDSNLVVDVVLEATHLASVNAVARFGSSIYAWTNRGVLEIGDAGIRNLSPQLKRPLEKAYADRVTDQVTALFNFTGELQIENFHGEVWLRPEFTDGEDYRGEYYVYNIANDEWSRCTLAVACVHYSQDQNTLVFMEELGAGDSMQKFQTVNQALPQLNQGDANFILNRSGSGEPGMLKQFREVVLLFQAAGTTAVITPTCNSFVDSAAGGGQSSSVEVINISDEDPSPHKVSVGAQAGLATQFWFQMLCTADTAEWALDGLVIRVDPKTDRTGSVTGKAPNGGA